MASKVWKLEKYARFSQNSAADIQTLKLKGHWEQFDGKPIFISIEQPLNLIIKQNEDILESFTLISALEWLKAFARDDNILFFCRKKNDVRRFRIKFSSYSGQSSKENCMQFCHLLTEYVPVEVVDGSLGSSQLPHSQQTYFQIPMPQTNKNILPNSNGHTGPLKVSVAATVKNILTKNTSALPTYYQSGNLHVDDSTVATCIKTCILDPNFPSFVEEVERHLKEIVNHGSDGPQDTAEI